MVFRKNLVKWVQYSLLSSKFIGETVTIFQKMILVPVLSLILYGSFITYSFFEHKQSNQQIQTLRDDYVPVMNILNENIHLFEGLRDTFKDTVLAQESLWLDDALTIKLTLEDNLHKLQELTDIVDKTQLQNTQLNLQNYYLHANDLAKGLLTENDILLSDPNAVQKVEQYAHLSEGNFQSLKVTVQNGFIETIDNNTALMNQLLFWGGIITVSSVLILMVVTFFLSLSTRNSFISIVERTKLLASGDTDFSKRLKRVQRDELGVLIYWFNKLSDKLEADYLKLEALSITDKLTQLNNRTRTDQFLPAAIEHSHKQKETLVLVIIDIDHFKRVNDDFGHLAGDDVLKIFAAILKNSGKSGDYISRWGGEEFVLVWQNIDFESAIDKAQIIRKGIENSEFPTVGKVTASMGLTLLKKDDSVETLIARADKNLYQAKESGRNRVVVDA